MGFYIALEARSLSAYSVQLYFAWLSLLGVSAPRFASRESPLELGLTLESRQILIFSIMDP